MKFNDQAREYNSYIKKFPKNMIAGMFNFDEKAYFHATEGAEKAPEVKF
jgi:LemA protein